MPGRSEVRAPKHPCEAISVVGRVKKKGRDGIVRKRREVHKAVSRATIEESLPMHSAIEGPAQNTVGISVQRDPSRPQNNDRIAPAKTAVQEALVGHTIS